MEAKAHQPEANARLMPAKRFRGYRWRSPRDHPAGVVALLALAVIGMEITGVQPLLLGAMVTEGRLSNAELGLATTAEFLALAATLGLAGALLEPKRLRLIAGLAALSAALINLLSLRLSGTPFIMSRAGAGIAEGLLVWMPACMVARAHNAAFWSGVSLTAQCIAQLAFAAIVGNTLMHQFGSNGGFAVLAALSLVALLALPAIPDSFAPLESDDGASEASALPGPAGLAGLAAVFLLTAFAIGLFAYIGPLALQYRLGSDTLGIIISVILAFMILGALLASAAARRLTYYQALIISLIAYAAVLLMLAQPLAATPFIAVGALFGLFQTFLLPFHLPLVIEADPTRRAATILPGIQLAGAASGPVICAMFVTDTDARGALAACAAFLAGAFIIITLLRLRSRVANKALRA